MSSINQQSVNLDFNAVLNTGMELVLFGMGTVFVFLVLLIFSTQLMSAFIHFVEKKTSAKLREQPPSVIEKRSNETQEPVVNSLLVAIITAAIHQHRSKN